MKIPLKFDKDTLIYQSFYIIENIQYPLIIGTDFLENNKANVDYSTKMLYLHNGLAQVALISTKQNAAKADKDIQLPARKMTLIPVKIPKCFDGKQIILEPWCGLEELSYT